MLIKKSLNILPNLILPHDYLTYNNTIKKETQYKYFSTCVLITNTNDMYNLIDYIFWHLNICKFDHILIINNNNEQNYNNIKLVISLFDSTKVTFITDNNPLYKIHSKIVNSFSSKYIMFIDDDEFLYISDKFKSINDILEHHIDYFKYSINWVHFFNNKLLKTFDTRYNSYINTFKYYYLKTEYKDIKFNLVKTIYSTELNHHILSDNIKTITVPSFLNTVTTTWNEIKPFTVHNGLTIFNNNILPSYNLTNYKINYNYDNADINDINIENSDIFLAHYKYTAINKIIYKLNKNRDYISIAKNSYNINYNINKILDLYNSLNNTVLKYNDVLSIKYNKYKNEILTLKTSYANQEKE